MCDYSLHNVRSRPGRVGDRLVTKRFTSTRGFAALEQPNVAVCLLPGTELAFDAEARWDRPLLFWRNKLGDRIARFRRVRVEVANVHHDALEFPNGRIVLLTQMCEGQLAVVLQLPASPRAVRQEPDPEAKRSLTALDTESRPPVIDVVLPPW